MKVDQWMPEIELVSNSNSEVFLTLEFPEQLPIFQGHFPDFHITPGVIQVHLFVKMVQKYFEKEFMPVDLPMIKFMSPIVPGKKVNLKISRNGGVGNFCFTYSIDGHTFSKGSARIG